MTDSESFGLADPGRDQYFLTASKKLALLVAAADIKPDDHVVEVGAGVGTVARSLPASAVLTVVEMDSRLTEALVRNVPRASVVTGDGIALLRDIRCDVLISNLPTELTPSLLQVMREVGTIRRAVVTASVDADFSWLLPALIAEQVTTIGGEDFSPPQPSTSALVKVERVEPEQHD